jgi:hypothetical protein
MRTIASLVVASFLLPSLTFAQSTRPVADSRVNAATALARTVPEVKINAVSLESAIDFVRDITGLNIHVNWRALEMLNVTRETPVTLKLANVSARRVLRALLDETGVGENLTWYIDEGVVEVTTKEISDAQLITRVYPVEDLIMTVPDFVGPSFSLESQGRVSGGGGGGGGGGSGLFQGGTNTTNNNAGNSGDTRSKTQRAEDLVKLVQETVRPEVWRENGGTSSIRYFNGHLIVTAPRSVHEALGH